MNKLKALFAVLALSLSMHAFAMTDDESVEFTDALGKGDMKVVKQYVAKDPKVVNEKFFAWSPIQIAATKGQFELVKYLKEKGADIDYVHPVTKMTAFHLAAFDNYDEIVKYLAKSGADIQKKMKGDISIIRVMKDEGERGANMVKLLTSLGVKDDGCQDEKCF
ncbi:ankyrin repeat domain-containing protein [Methylotenera versatilis]|uniref:ankyrin repeat domain-containing protein n=1 Tax=Methylotenera versatilis TaxID=1055487 RepID=UPI000646929B|nr:ankyrin repeat domain-containing protein [Methylotenera versatilis]